MNELLSAVLTSDGQTFRLTFFYTGYNAHALISVDLIAGSRPMR